jgi:hypothetical protein
VFPAVPGRADVLRQSNSRERFGEKDFAYVSIEAEDFHENDRAFVGASWLLTSDEEARAMIVNDVDTGELIEPEPSTSPISSRCRPTTVRRARIRRGISTCWTTWVLPTS